MSPELDQEKVINRRVREENVRRILEAGEILIANNHLEVEGRYVQALETAQDPLELYVQIGRFPHLAGLPKNVAKVLFSAIIELRPESNISLSERFLHFYEPRKKDVRIYSYSSTKPGYESRGYGQGLFYFGHQLIWKLLELKPFEKKSVEAVVIDSAHGGQPGTKRNAWSANMACRLGYQPFASDSSRLPAFRFKFR